MRDALAIERNQNQAARDENLRPFAGQLNRENIRIGTLPPGATRRRAMRQYQERKAQLAAGLTPFDIGIQNIQADVAREALPFSRAQTEGLGAASTLDRAKAELALAEAGLAGAQTRSEDADASLTSTIRDETIAGNILPPGTDLGRVPQVEMADSRIAEAQRKERAALDEAAKIRDHASEEAKAAREHASEEAWAARKGAQQESERARKATEDAAVSLARRERLTAFETKFDEIVAERNDKGQLTRRAELIGMLIREGAAIRKDTGKPSTFAELSEDSDDNLIALGVAAIAKLRKAAYGE